ncbi:cytochrome C oxidase subunit II [Gracilibacillus sp. YIM 98692]|uniref:cytochrome C oxidase subunit II n=1 Tax=Gracilibacillus sp. YIM 98692 TaxID=2663532 RepID=UPI0013D0DA65|nr:cytochrome C oxidase subunit II [Gracilibacillus sp. YIM 98692]
MKKFMFILVLLTLAFVLAACGGEADNSEGNNGENTEENNESAAGDESVVHLTASNWQFDQEEYTVPAGEVTVELTNEEGFHGIEVVGTDIAVDGEGSATGVLEPGEYTIRCSIQCGTGHSEMVSTLIVQ